MERHHASEGGEQPPLTEPVTETAEQPDTPPAGPRIFLADASPGRPTEHVVRGVWLDAAVDELELEQAAHDLLAVHSPDGAAAYRIGAATGFEGFEVVEHDSLATIARVARGIAEHGRAFVAYLEAHGASQEAIERFSDYYLGTFASVSAWAEQVVDDFGWQDALARTVPPEILPFLRFDFDRLGREMTYDAHVVEDDERGEIHVFRLHA